MGKAKQVIDPQTLPTFDLAERLQTEEDIAAYLQVAFEDEDPAEIAHAMGVVARARNMAQLSRETGISREGLYRALSNGGNPTIETISKVLHVFGLRLTVVPRGKAA